MTAVGCQCATVLGIVRFRVYQGLKDNPLVPRGKHKSDNHSTMKQGPLTPSSGKPRMVPFTESFGGHALPLRSNLGRKAALRDAGRRLDDCVGECRW